MKAKTYLAQGCGTYSKLKRNYAYNVPDSVTYGHLDCVMTKRGTYCDWSCGLGSNLRGWHNNFSLNCDMAEPVAKLLCNRFGYDKAKILQSGSQACDAAIRIARTFTGHSDVYWTGYHGCGNTFICEEEPGNGTVWENSWKFEKESEIIKKLRYYDHLEHGGYCSETGEAYDGHRIAAIIIEPVKLDYSKQRIAELRELRRLTKKMGIVLIFDEIITGMRFLKGSVAKATGIKPDLMCVGKAIGNGYPFSAVLGSEKLMEQDYFISNTHNANEIALEAAGSILKTTSDKDIARLWKTGKWFICSANKILSRLKYSKIQIMGYPTRGEWQADNLDTLTAIWELMAEDGHICGRAYFLNFEHSKSRIVDFLLNLEIAVKTVNDGYKRKGRCVSFAIKKRN